MLRPRILVAMIASIAVVILGALFQRFGPAPSLPAATEAAQSAAGEDVLSGAENGASPTPEQAPETAPAAPDPDGGEP